MAEDNGSDPFAHQGLGAYLSTLMGGRVASISVLMTAPEVLIHGNDFSAS
jgi:hypothetical protein